MTQEQQLRRQLVKMMQGGQAFRTREELLEGLTVQEAGRQMAQMPYTIWQLLEHMRFAQHDILDFCRNPDYAEPSWPDDYWPGQATPPDHDALQNTLRAIAHDLEEMIGMVQDPGKDLYEPLPHGQGQTLLREAMLVAEHNAYHLGQVVLLRKVLGQMP